MPSRDELIAERDRARDAVVEAAVRVCMADGSDNWQSLLHLSTRVRAWQKADAAVEDGSHKPDYRRARGIITPVVDELPEETISRMRDRGQP